MNFSFALSYSSLFATACAFAPTPTQHRPKSSLSAFSAKPSKLVGYYKEDAQADANARLNEGAKLPGNFGFDPLGFGKRDYGTTGKSTNGKCRCRISRKALIFVYER